MTWKVDLHTFSIISLLFSSKKVVKLKCKKIIIFLSECYDDYSEQTIRTIALQDLQTGTIGRSKCKDLIEVTDANYIQASEEIVTDVVLGN